jgi:hypothetical protein
MGKKAKPVAKTTTSAISQSGPAGATSLATRLLDFFVTLGLMLFIHGLSGS